MLSSVSVTANYNPKTLEYLRFEENRRGFLLATLNVNLLKSYPSIVTYLKNNFSTDEMKLIYIAFIVNVNIMPSLHYVTVVTC